MRILVVYCHPVESSYCNALHRTVLTSLREKHELRDCDLYASGFNPVLSQQERLDYFDHTENNRAKVQEYIDDLHWCEGLVFVFPTWWYNLPAMLKGWLDRVFLPDVAFVLTGDKRNPLESKLRHIRLLAAVTTYGSPWWLVKWVGEPGRKALIRSLRPLVHKKCKTIWLAKYEMDMASQQDRERFLQRVSHTFSKV